MILGTNGVSFPGVDPNLYGIIYVICDPSEPRNMPCYCNYANLTVKSRIKLFERFCKLVCVHSTNSLSIQMRRNIQTIGRLESLKRKFTSYIIFEREMQPAIQSVLYNNTMWKLQLSPRDKTVMPHHVKRGDMGILPEN